MKVKCTHAHSHSGKAAGDGCLPVHICSVKSTRVHWSGFATQNNEINVYSGPDHGVYMGYMPQYAAASLSLACQPGWRVWLCKLSSSLTQRLFCFALFIEVADGPKCDERSTHRGRGCVGRRASQARMSAGERLSDLSDP